MPVYMHIEAATRTGGLVVENRTEDTNITFCTTQQTKNKRIYMPISVTCQSEVRY